jgi:predicted transcriptional regulator
MADEQDKLAKLTAGVVAAYVGAHNVAVGDLPGLIASVHGAFSRAGEADEAATGAPSVVKATAAQIRKSITHDALISFIDGRPYKTLKRHLRTNGLSVEDYKAMYGLPADYPTSAPSYSAVRSAMAKANGLGQGGRRRKGAAKTR